MSVGNATSRMSSDVATFGFVQSCPPFVVRARLPLSPVANTAWDDVARSRESVAVSTVPTGAQFSPPLADITVAPACPTAVAALVVLKAAAKMRLVEALIEVHVPPPSSVRSSWSPWLVEARQRVVLAQRIFVTLASGASAGTVWADQVVPPSTVLRIVLPSPAANPVSVLTKKKLLSFAPPVNAGVHVLPPSVVLKIDPPAL